MNLTLLLKHNRGNRTQPSLDAPQLLRAPNKPQELPHTSFALCGVSCAWGGRAHVEDTHGILQRRPGPHGALVFPRFDDGAGAGEIDAVHACPTQKLETSQPLQLRVDEIQVGLIVLAQPSRLLGGKGGVDETRAGELALPLAFVAALRELWVLHLLAHRPFETELVEPRELLLEHVDRKEV